METIKKITKLGIDFICASFAYMILALIIFVLSSFM